MNSPNPCMTCGACCAFFRAFFYRVGTGDASGTIPVTVTKQISPYHQCMQSANQKSPRCMTLIGQPGVNAYCSIYEHHSSTCREFPISEEHGIVNEVRNRARAKYGLPPLY